MSARGICPVCGSESIDKEILAGHRTGDYVCRSCNHASVPKDFTEAEKKAEQEKKKNNK